MHQHDNDIVWLTCLPNGQTWSVVGEGSPEQLGELREVVDDLAWLKDRTRLRIAGLMSNVKLIASLYEELVVCDKLERIELASPQILRGVPAVNAEAVLCTLRQCLWPASLGGWHVMNDKDFATYELGRHMATESPSAASVCARLSTHPLFPEISFIPDNQPPEMAVLLSVIRDPRWFIDPNKPERSARLRSYLGIDRLHKEPGKRQLLSGYAARAWMGYRDPPGDGEREIPNNFLWRIWAKAGGGDRGVLKATQAFISFLRNTWLDRLALRRADPLFDPAKFFKTEAEISTYREHCKRLEV